MPIARCPEGHFPRYVISYPEDSEVGILLDSEGSPTGMWEDGTLGLAPHHIAAIAPGDAVFCADHKRECTWEHEDEPAAA